MFQDLDAQWSKPMNDPDPPASPTTEAVSLDRLRHFADFVEAHGIGVGDETDDKFIRAVADELAAAREQIERLEGECRLREKTGEALATRIHAPVTGYEARVAELEKELHEEQTETALANSDCSSYLLKKQDLEQEIAAMREAVLTVVRDASGRSGGSVYMIHAEPFKSLKATLGRA